MQITGVSFDKLAEDRIREAIESGEFDNLPGRGKPINLDDYFNVAEEWRVCISLLKNSGFLPQEMQLLKEVAELKALLAQTLGPAQRHEVERQVRERTLQYDLLMERRRAGKRSGR